MAIRTCEICNKRPAKYVCQECGREICEVCFDPYTWVCVECYRRIRREVPPLGRPPASPWPFPVKLFFLSFIVIFVGMLLLMAAAILSGGSTSFGGVVFIGPIPIIIGSGPYFPLAIIIAIILMVLSILLFIGLRK